MDKQKSANYISQKKTVKTVNLLKNFHKTILNTALLNVITA